MIFVSVGTHHQPFERLLREVETWASDRTERVRVQRGVSCLPMPSCDVTDWLDLDEHEKCLREAHTVVLHGGSSSFLEARSWGHTPIVVPRRPEFAEHVDDHQLRFAASLDGQARVCTPETLHWALQQGPTRAAGAASGQRAAERRSAAFSQALQRLLCGIDDPR